MRRIWAAGVSKLTTVMSTPASIRPKYAAVGVTYSEGLHIREPRPNTLVRANVGSDSFNTLQNADTRELV